MGKDVDLENGDVRVTQARSRATDEMTAPKSHRGRRVLPLPALTAAALREHRRRQRQERLVMGPQWTDHGLVFTTTYGTPLDGSNIGAYFRRHVARAGARPVRFHDLRHSCASLLLSQGVSIREIMEWLGHSQISLTANTYTHVAPALKREAANRMDAMFPQRAIRQ